MIKERIMQFISKEGLSPSQFAEILGIQRSSISHILSGRNKPSYDFFNKLINCYPNINLEWFFNGSGDCYKLNKDLNLEIPLNINNKDNNVSQVNNDSNITTSKNTNVNNIEKVLLLFTDGTFKVFNDL